METGQPPRYSLHLQQDAEIHNVAIQENATDGIAFRLKRERRLQRWTALVIGVFVAMGVALCIVVVLAILKVL